MENHSERLAFRPRARLLQLLGDELIGSARLAVFELVKNAYDADATDVRVTLDRATTSNATIVVEDNGEGMTADIIRNIWLVPGHNHRGLARKALVRTSGGRLPLGEKGLGRFAVHKLGNRIELVTRAKGSGECVVMIDWETLLSTEFLEDARVEVVIREPEIFTGDITGTRVTIGRLRETWTRGEVRRLYRQVTSIASPFTRRSDRFDVTLQVPQHEDWLSDIPSMRNLLARAPWKYWFRVEEGRFDWTYEFRGVPGLRLETRTVERTDLRLEAPGLRDDGSEDLFLRKSRVPAVVTDLTYFEGIGPITGEFYAYDRSSEVLSRIGEAQFIENFLDQNGGVRIYRDGIRVYNYGEPGDDWLGLDLRRVNSPVDSLSRNLIVGAIDIDLSKSLGLVEKTNREGFVDSPDFTRLRQAVIGALAPLQTERAQDKERIRAVTGKSVTLEERRIAAPLDRLRSEIEKRRLTTELGPIVNRIEFDYREMRDTLLRAGLSQLSLALVFHEIERGVRVLADAISADKGSDRLELEARELVRLLDGASEMLRRGDRRSYDLAQLLRRACDVNRVRFRSHQIKIVCPALEAGTPVYADFAFGLTLGALNNLIDNAIHWNELRHADDPEGRRIFLDIRDVDGTPTVVVADNGPGLTDDPERLKQPFFTRRPEGLGLGLYFANLVMELNQGRLMFPTADEMDVPEGFDGAVFALAFNRGK